MAAVGRFCQSLVGVDGSLSITFVANGGTNVYAMASLNTGLAFRFMAPDTRDVLSVRFNWFSVSAAGTVTLRLETIDATTGKPSGSLYDSNATKAFTPTTGWQLVTFDTPPTAGLTAGTEYAIVLLTTAGGTTQTLRHYLTVGRLPTAALTAADGTTRSNFAEIVNSCPVCTVIFEDAVEESLGFSQFAALGNYNVFGTAATGMKFVVPTGCTWSVHGVYLSPVTRTGTPAGDLRVRILNSSDSAVANSTITADKDSLLNSSSRRGYIPFSNLVTLTAGTYRLVFDSASSANSSNCWAVRSLVANASALVPSGAIQTSTADYTAGTISWTDTATEQSVIELEVDDITAASGGILTPGGMTGGNQQT